MSVRSPSYASNTGYLGKIIAHRGASGLAPENTLAAFEMAFAQGARAVEFDVTVSSDGVAVLMHDDDLARCSNDVGPVILKSITQLQALDVGSWFAPEYAGERIPTLSAALDWAQDQSVRVNLEIKPTAGWEQPTVAAIVNVLQKKASSIDALMVTSFNAWAMDLFTGLMPDVSTGYLTDAVPADWRQRMARWGCVALHCHDPFVTPELIQSVHGEGHRVHVFTVNDPARAQALFSWGVDGVLTDRPDVLLTQNLDID
jgi:glycerophosphoryl diester phosphodiesterase